MSLLQIILLGTVLIYGCHAHGGHGGHGGHSGHSGHSHSTHSHFGHMHSGQGIKYGGLTFGGLLGSALYGHYVWNNMVESNFHPVGHRPYWGHYRPYSSNAFYKPVTNQCNAWNFRCSRYFTGKEPEYFQNPCNRLCLIG